MKKHIAYWQMTGFIFTGVVGTLLHFFFDWTGKNVIVALFSAVNESIWEHLKLLFYPTVVFALLEYRSWGKEVDSFWCIKLSGILFGLAFIPVVYYTYTGLLGIKADWVNIAIFFIAAGLAYWLETKLFQRGFACRLPAKTAITVICMVGVVFTVFTFWPPHIPLFADPLTDTYGFWQKP